VDRLVHTFGRRETLARLHVRERRHSYARVRRPATHSGTVH
jgi:hypothetical protein